MIRNFCTYFDANYLDRGLALHESMEYHCQPYHLWVLAMCARTEEVLQKLALSNVTVLPMARFETGELVAVKRNRTYHEYIWSCTPFWMLRVLDDNDITHLSYIDADCSFYSDPTPLFGELFEANVAITPHRFSPSRRWMAAENGLYNVGLVYVRRTWAGLECIRDWGQRCLARCVQSEGADQKYWDDLVDEYGAHVIQHKGVDLAPWNQAEQYSYSTRAGQIYIDGDPLIFYHFHKRLKPGFDLDPFVACHIYPPYRAALERAETRVARL